MKPLPIPPQLEAACTKLREAGSRITRPRLAILTELITRGQPTPIYELHSALRKSTCDIVTVYRCLEAFEEIGLVRRSFLFSGTTVWEMALDETHSFHVTCKATNRIARMESNVAGDLREFADRVKAELESRGFRDVVPSIQFFAIAPAPSDTLG